MRIVRTLFFRILMDCGLDRFPKISIRSVRMKRVWKRRSKEDRIQMTQKARDSKTPESYTNRRYTRKGLASLQRHMREKVNTPEHYKTRDMSYSKDPLWRKMMSDLRKEASILMGYTLNDPKETERINDYAGVLTASQLSAL